MAHHSGHDSPLLRQLYGNAERAPLLGATGKFPLGKIVPEDEGELALAVGHAEGKVVMDFGKPTAWIGFTAEQADELAATLRTHADAVRTRG